MPQRATLLAGVGGIAVLTTALAHMAGGGPSKVDKPTAQQTSVRATANAGTITSNQAGPWYAFCNEYATDQFDHGTDPTHELGLSSHQVPSEAESGSVEITRDVPGYAKLHETEKFSVHNHAIGDFTDCVPAGQKLRIVIATVPDPNATQMPAEFDRDIDAIQHAAAVWQYNYTRFWFPWRTVETANKGSTDAEAEAHRREEPGILCFRKNDSDLDQAKERLFVLLVGETPTSGINRVQLAHAIDYRDQLLRKKDIVEEDTGLLKIAGPHFSSSLPDLQDVLNKTIYKEQAAATNPVVTLVSPDVSSPDLIGGFRKYCQDQKPNCILNTLAFDSTQAKKIALDYLSEIGYQPDTVAELIEDESAFSGTEIYPHLPSRSTNQDYRISLRFPRDLSTARTASDAESEHIADSSLKYIGLPKGQSPTRLTVQDAIDSDTPPAFGDEQQPADVARRLQNIILQIRAARIRAVVVDASNPLDRIYLLEYLHNEIPDVRAVTIDADSLELNRPQFVDLAGTLAITSLPIIVGLNNVKPDSPPNKTPLTFLSSRQAGEFLAIETLIDRRVKPATLASPPALSSACAAVSVAGEDRFYLLPGTRDHERTLRFPCAQLASAGPVGAKSSDYALTVPDNYRSPSFFLPFLLSLIVISGIHLFCLWQSGKNHESLFSYPHPLEKILEARRLYLLFVINNQILLVDFLGVRMLLAVFLAHPVDLRPETYLFCGALVVLLGIALWNAFHFFAEALARIRPEHSPDGKELSQGLFLAVAYLVTTLATIWWLPALASHHIVTLIRVTNVTSGLSPVSAIVAVVVGYFVWGWFQLKRLDWIATRKIDLKIGPDVPVLGSQLDCIMKITDALTPVKQNAMLIIFALLLLVDKLVLWKPLSGFERWPFHLWITVWGFCLLLFTVILGCVHAGLLWQRLRDLLESLETTPLREAFRALGQSGELSIKIWDLAESERSFTILNKTVESMQALPGVTREQIDEAKKYLQTFIDFDRRGEQVPAGTVDLLHPFLNAGMEDALRVFENPTASFAPEEHLRYLALRLIAVIRYCMLHIRTLILSVAYCYLAAVLSIMFYAFEGRQTLGDLAVTVFLVLLAWIAMMMYQFQGSSMLRLLQDGETGEGSILQVLPHLLSVGGLPLLAIITAQYPAVGSFLLSILGPFLRALQ